MNWLWYYWPASLLFILLVMFAIPEGLAFKWGGPTFSQFMATTSSNPVFGKLWIWAWGFLIGLLTAHFLGWCMYTCNGTLTGG